MLNVSTPSFLLPKLPASNKNGNRNAWFNVQHLFRSENSPSNKKHAIIPTRRGDSCHTCRPNDKGTSKGKGVLLQAWSGPEGSRKLGFPDYMTAAQDGGKVVSRTHQPPLPPGDSPGTHFR